MNMSVWLLSRAFNSGMNLSSSLPLAAVVWEACAYRGAALDSHVVDNLPSKLPYRKLSMGEKETFLKLLRLRLDDSCHIGKSIPLVQRPERDVSSIRTRPVTIYSLSYSFVLEWHELLPNIFLLWWWLLWLLLKEIFNHQRACVHVPSWGNHLRSILTKWKLN